MRPFLDSGFFLTLLFETNGSAVAWNTVNRLEGPLVVGSLQIFNSENGLRRQMAAENSTDAERAIAANALQRLQVYLDEQVIQVVPIDYEIAIQLASQWQQRTSKTLPALLFLWPAIAVAGGATEFLSFDPRTRALARAAGLRLLPNKL